MPACRSAAVRLGASCASVCVRVCEGEGAWGAHVFQTRTSQDEEQTGRQDTAELSSEAHSICAFGFLKNALKAQRGGAGETERRRLGRKQLK